MLIDWFTVVAQTINFLILVWLLKRFLYTPILDAIDAREKRIAAELADAEATKADARQERDEFTHKNEEFNRQRAGLLSQAEEEASSERERLLGQARKESDVLRTKWQEALRNEQQSLSEELSRRTREEVFAIARKTLKDLAATSLEEQMTTAFLYRLREQESAEKNALQVAFKSTATPAIVRSTFNLPSAQRHAIESAIRDVLNIPTQIQFETAPDLVSGIELLANGHKIAWSIDHYLSSLKKNIEDALKLHPDTPAVPDTPPIQQANEYRT